MAANVNLGGDNWYQRHEKKSLAVAIANLLFTTAVGIAAIVVAVKGSGVTVPVDWRVYNDTHIWVQNKDGSEDYINFAKSISSQLSFQGDRLCLDMLCTPSLTGSPGTQGDVGSPGPSTIGPPGPPSQVPGPPGIGEPGPPGNCAHLTCQTIGYSRDCCGSSCKVCPTLDSCENGVCVPTVQLQEHYFMNRSYVFIEAAITHANAKAQCQTLAVGGRSATLATIRSQEENDYVLSLVPDPSNYCGRTRSIWLGADMSNGVRTWDDGSAFAFTSHLSGSDPWIVLRRCDGFWLTEASSLLTETSGAVCVVW